MPPNNVLLSRLNSSLFRSPVSKVFRWLLVVEFLLWLAIECFASELFRALGFEYAALWSLALTLLLGTFAAWDFAGTDRNDSRKTFWECTCILAIIPLLLGCLIPNCALGEGVIAYLEVPLLAIPVGLLFARGAALLGGTRSKAIVAYLSIWFTTLLLSLVPGYLNPQIFTYGWEYGLFPGLVWDEALSLSQNFLLFQSMNLAIALVFVVIAGWYRSKRATLQEIAFVMLLGTSAVIIQSNADSLGFTSSHERVGRFLSTTCRINSRTTLHFAPNSLNAGELLLLRANVLWYESEINRQLKLRDTLHPIDIYLYPSSEQMYEYVGTRTAIISKPWLSEVHLPKSGTAALKHELTHLMLRELGSAPFDINFQTGITEGIAVAMESPSDGLRTVHERAAKIIQLDPSANVSSVISFFGFASHPASTSYQLAGSFARFLLDHFSREQFRTLYASGNFQTAYGSTLSQLDSTWRQSLRPFQSSLTMFDSLRTSLGMSDTSLVLRPCVRRLGRMMLEAGKLMQLQRYAEADSLYAIVDRESHNPLALQSRLIALIAQGKFQIALRLLNDHAPYKTLRWFSTLETRAMLEFMLRDTAAARADFTRVSESEASSGAIVDGYLFATLSSLALTADANGKDWNQYFIASRTDKSAEELSSMLEGIANGMVSAEHRGQTLYLASLESYAAGDLRRARDELQLAIPVMPIVTFQDSVIKTLARVRYALLNGATLDVPELPARFAGLSESVEEVRRKIRYLNQVGLTLVH